MAEEDRWRRRFHLFMGVRLFGLATFLAGLAVVFTDILRPGGWPVVGSVIMLLGIIDGVVAPKLLHKHWRAEDRERK